MPKLFGAILSREGAAAGIAIGRWSGMLVELLGEPFLAPCGVGILES